MRHLPESSQKEYKKLLKRMELLEKQKELRLKKLQNTNIGNGKVDTIKITIKNKSPDPKRIVIKASNTISTPAKTLAAKPAQTNVNKMELFHKVETQYTKNESMLMDNLCRSLALVETATVSKNRKLELEARRSILLKEMESVESELKVETTKVSRIYPQIQFLHRTMVDLKTKRARLSKYANTLGNAAKIKQIRFGFKTLLI